MRKISAEDLFLQCAPLDVVFSALPSPFDEDSQRVFYSTAVEPFKDTFPPPLKYLKMFFNRLMKMLEKNDLCVIDELAEMAVQTSIKDFSVLDQGEGEGYIVFRVKSNASKIVPPNNHDVMGDGASKIQQGKALTPIVIKRHNSHNQVGMKLWKAGLFMAEVCASVPQLFWGRSILELGSGTGITGITLASICNASKVYATDFHDEVLRNLENNVCVNMLNASMIVAPLDWSAVSESVLSSLNASILFAADCTYSNDITLHLLRTISAFLHYKEANDAPCQSKLSSLEKDSIPKILLQSSKFCLLCSTLRSSDTMDFFFKTMQSLSNELSFQDVSAWAVQACVVSNFYFDGGTDDLRCYCIVPVKTDRPTLV